MKVCRETVRELGIIFGADSVRALLAGRKTVTRRLVKGDLEDEVPCRYRAGDRLWVRETWAPVERESDGIDGIRFLADDMFIPIANTSAAAEAWLAAARNDHSGKWRTPLYMPRWASRIYLEVADVRRERLLDITEADARAEGICPTEHGTYLLEEESERFEFATAREAYFFAWDGINPRAPHDTNPRVDRIEFRTTTCRT